MLSNAYFVAKIGADTAENEYHFAENLPKIGNYPTGLRVRASGSGAGRAAATPPPSFGRSPGAARTYEARRNTWLQKGCGLNLDFELF